jgi:integrase
MARGCIITVEPGKHRLIVPLPKGPDGRRKSKWTTIRGSRREAERRLALLVAEVTAPGYAEPSKLTVAQFLARWLTESAPLRAAPQTVETYRSVIRLHLSPGLGHLPLATLTNEQIQAWVTRQAGTYAPRTVALQLKVLRLALKRAVIWRLIPSSPCAGVELPAAPRARPLLLTERQVGALLEAASSHWLYPVVVLAVATGMRRNEMLAVRWADVDLDRGVLTVTRAMVGERGGVRFAEPKTEAGRRTIVLPAFAVEALRLHHARQQEQKAIVGRGYLDNDLVCAAPDGRLLWPGKVSGAFPPLLAQAGLPRVGLHSLRHLHASSLLADGVPITTVSARMGHASPAISLALYGHAIPGEDSVAAAAVERRVRGGSG